MVTKTGRTFLHGGKWISRLGVGEIESMKKASVNKRILINAHKATESLNRKPRQFVSQSKKIMAHFGIDINN